jgi:hypothetical protein
MPLTVGLAVDSSQVMIDHTIICKVHTSRLTTLVRNEVRCSCNCTKILTFLSMKLELLSPLLFVSPCLSSQKIFSFSHFPDCYTIVQNPKSRPTFMTCCRVVAVGRPKNPITAIAVTGFLLDFLVSFWSPFGRNPKSRPAY